MIERRGPFDPQPPCRTHLIIAVVCLVLSWVPIAGLIHIAWRCWP